MGRGVEGARPVVGRTAVDRLMDPRRIRPADRVRQVSHLHLVERRDPSPAVLVVPTPPQSPLDTAEPVVRERGGIVRAGLARAARALRRGWAWI